MASATPPDVVLELIERFERNREAYRSGRYNETQVRREFIDPMFEALGWDVDNKGGYAEAYKDVIHEDAIKVGGVTKAPDYCFRIGGARKFFLEAKKPSVSIKDEPHPAFQLRRYAWSAKLPLSILTDFEEFAVYDCRVRPHKDDKPSKARTLYMGYADYAADWDDLAAIFAKEAVLKGSFDKYADTSKRKRGTAEVDTAFLTEIEAWRDMLARNIALRNPNLTQRELNFSVQRTIDRIIFLRICEDRRVEQYGRLMALRNGAHVYERLGQLFVRADERYNSGLFYFHPEKGRDDPADELTLSLAIDDKPLKDIIRALYYPESPYEFSVLPADILGQVYEQFLGKVIRLTSGHRAVVEDKPEVKKAGGVYYTPTYIVDYIVQHTVGKLVEGKRPGPRGGVSKLRILDPACGSGSFLIGAYQYLLDWHRDRYVEDGPEKWAKGSTPALYQIQPPEGSQPSGGLGSGGSPETQPPEGLEPSGGSAWRLTTAERKRILLNNIYGVDIDPQAVEVTKLSLLLKVLEGESEQTLARQLRFFHERALPDLSSNIKCGNSLIGPDFYQGKQLGMFDDEERYRINVFDWDAEFSQIMEGGGFDAVIGNPPYIRVRHFRELHPEQIDYLESHYQCAVHVWDIYLLFLEQAHALTRERGLFGFIVPIQTLHQPNCHSIRALLLRETSVNVVADLSRLKVFQGPTVKNCILVCEERKGRDARIKTFLPDLPGDLRAGPINEWPQGSAMANPGYSLKIDLLSPKKRLCDKLSGLSWTLGELCYVTFGLRSCAKGKGQGGKGRLITSDAAQPEARPYLEGRDITRYALRPTGRFIRYLPAEMYSPRSPTLFETRKIVSQSMLSRMRLVATIDDGHHYAEQSLVCIIPHGILTDDTRPADVPLDFILGMINSTLETFYFATYVIDYSLGGGLVHATPGSQQKLLVPKASESQVQGIVSLAGQMLALQNHHIGAKTGHDKTAIQRQIVATDREIDRLVYELYGLTEDEIKIVEEATQ